MSIGYTLIWIFLAFYFAMGTGTAIKHKGKIKPCHLPFYIFSLPAKALVKAISILPLICYVIGMDYITRKESDGDLDDMKTSLTIPISYFK